MLARGLVHTKKVTKHLNSECMQTPPSCIPEALTTRTRSALTNDKQTLTRIMYIHLHVKDIFVFITNRDVILIVELEVRRRHLYRDER